MDFRLSGGALSLAATVLSDSLPISPPVHPVDGSTHHIVAVGLTVDDLLTAVRSQTRWKGSDGAAANPFVALRAARLAAIAAEVAPRAGSGESSTP